MDEISIEAMAKAGGNNMTTVVISSSIFGLILVTLWLRKTYSFFTNRQVPGPTPIPILGHVHKFLLHDLGKISDDYARKYGKIYGLYFGFKPRLMIADVETVQQICIKDFDVFTDHYATMLKNKYQENFIFMQKGDRWRRNRALMSPTFTSGKIRQMFKSLGLCAQDLTLLLKEQIDGLADTAHDRKTIVNAKDMFNLYTLDGIATCCYGLKLERAKGIYGLENAASRDKLVAMFTSLFKFNNLRMIPELLLPIGLLQKIGWKFIPESHLDPMARFVGKMIEARKSQINSKFNDYLQLLIDAKLDDKMELDDLDLVENHHAQLTHESLKDDQEKLVKSIDRNKMDKKLTDLEVTSGAMFLLFVGLETTSSLLSICAYNLSFHAEIQEKLYEEVSKIAKSDDKDQLTFDYDDLTRCQYLDAVISETLRYNPIAPMVDRVASRDYHFDKWNFSIPAGSVLFIAIHAIHHNPDYWPEPEKFDPERFMPGNREKIVPGSYTPFGQGPRHCVGMRFSLTEAKLGLAHVIMKYRFEAVPGLKFPAQRVVGFTPGGIKDPRIVLKERCC